MMQGGTVYSPKIDPAIIPRLYRLAKALDIPMTRLVNRLLEHGIERLELGAEHVSDPPDSTWHRPAQTQDRQKKRRSHTIRERA